MRLSVPCPVCGQPLPVPTTRPYPVVGGVRVQVDHDRFVPELERHVLADPAAHARLFLPVETDVALPEHLPLLCLHTETGVTADRVCLLTDDHPGEHHLTDFPST